MAIAHYVYTIIDIAIDVVIKSKPAIGSAWIAPVDRVDINAKFKQVGNEWPLLM